jgi:hypothetical protein
MCARQPTGEYLDEQAAGLRLGASTMASYRKNIGLHLKLADYEPETRAVITGLITRASAADQAAARTGRAGRTRSAGGLQCRL